MYVCMYVYAFMCVCLYIRTDLRFVIVFCAFFCIYMLPILVIYVPATLRVRARESESIARSHVAVIGEYYCFLRYITTKYAAILNVLSLSPSPSLCLSHCLRKVTVLMGGGS